MGCWLFRYANNQGPLEAWKGWPEFDLGTYRQLDAFIRHGRVTGQAEDGRLYKKPWFGCCWPVKVSLLPTTRRSEVGLEFCLFFAWISNIAKAILFISVYFYILHANWVLE